jgi:YjjG family noncanonical pyrimidine nucleotidase
MAIPYQESYLPVYHEINSHLWRDFEKGLIDQVTLRLHRFERLFESLSLPCDIPAFSARYLTLLAEGAFLIAEAEETLSALRGGFNLAAITNGLSEIQGPRLVRAGLEDYFHAVVVSEEAGAAKPAPQVFDLAFERMGGPGKDTVLIIGDSLTSDIQGGHDYGIDTCWFNPTGRANDGTPSTYEIRRLPDLLPIVQRA